MTDETMQRLLGKMETDMEITGIASVAVSDGQIFMMSKKLLERLLTQVNESGEERVILFVKRGPEVSQKVEGN